jgi:hypothetical protein
VGVALWVGRGEAWVGDGDGDAGVGEADDGTGEGEAVAGSVRARSRETRSASVRSARLTAAEVELGRPLPSCSATTAPETMSAPATAPPIISGRRRSARRIAPVRRCRTGVVSAGKSSLPPG